MSFRQTCTKLSRFIFIFISLVVAVVAIAVLALTLWIRFDANFERALRANILNTTPSPYDLAETKENLRNAINIAFWVILGISIVTSIINLLGIVGSITMKRSLHFVYVVVIILLIVVQVGIGIFIIIYRPTMRAVTNRYCSLAFQYNTADASALLDRYQCCGDGTQSSFNQQCYQLGFYQRDCPTAVWNRLDFTLMISGLVVLGVILVEALSLVFAFVGIVNHRYGTLIN